MGLGRLFSGFLIAAVVAVAQGIPSDELRARSLPYVPPPPPNVLKSEVNLVEVPVVVRDGKHRAIAGLKQTDFQVFDMGKKQEVTTFSMETYAFTATTPAAGAPAGAAPAPAAETHRPRFITLCFDNIATPFADLRAAKTAAENFVKTRLTPGDKVTVVTTASVPPTLNYIDDVPKLVAAIEAVSLQQRSADRMVECPRITGYQAYVITNHLDNDTLEGVAEEDMACKRISHSQAIQDAQSLARMVWEYSLTNSRNTLYTIGALVDSMKQLSGRRMLLLASSGFLSGNLEYLMDEMTTKALHAEVVINSLDAKGLYTMVPGRPVDAPPMRGRSPRAQIAELSQQSRQESAKDDGMAQLALGTGGAFYHNSNDLERGFQELGAVPDVVYILGFSPTDTAKDGKFHPLKVKLASGHYTLQARMGYTAASKTAPVEIRQPTRLDTELLATGTRADIPVTIASELAKSEAGSPMLNVALHVDVKNMKFDTRADRRGQKLDFLIALLGPGGAFIAGRQGQVELSLKQATFDALVANEGFNIKLNVQAPPGNYTLRGVVQDAIEGKISSSSIPVDLH